jgi:hypothetical protein
MLCLPRLLRWIVGVVALAILVPAPGAGHAGTAPPPPTTPGTAVDNDFIPEDRDLSECISAVPRPGCGSESRSGWRQALVLVAILAGLAFIAWRIIRAARRGRPRTEGHDA